MFTDTVYFTHLCEPQISDKIMLFICISTTIIHGN